ncbi:MAG: FKBP-type peptidyl-prolyl cis-trans isomerase [Bacteroidia bacterium]
MSKNIHYNFSILIVILLFGCAGSNKTEIGKQEINSSLKVEYLRSYIEEPGSIGDIIEYDFKMSHNNKVLVSTYGIPDYRERAQLKDPEFDSDFMHVIKNLSVDDSVMITVNVQNIPEEHLPQEVTEKNGVLVLIVSIRNIWNEEQVMDKMVNDLSQNQPETWTKTSRGVRIFWDEKGDGSKAEFGDSVYIHVRQLFLSGIPFFDSRQTKTKKPIGFVLGEGVLMPMAWEDACSLASKGDKLTLISPYDMAYGTRDRKPVLKYSTLVFEIDVIDVKKN